MCPKFQEEVAPGLTRVVRRHLEPSVLGSCFPLWAPSQGRSSPYSGQMADSHSRLTSILSHLSGKTDFLFPTISAKVPEQTLLTPGHLPCSQGDALLFSFSGHLLYSRAEDKGLRVTPPKHGERLRVWTGGKVQKLPPGEGEGGPDRAGRTPMALVLVSCGCCNNKLLQMT